ncbi:hypothetical protein CPB83DRAFT_96829 [Crepidotus variabilis]|uniref:Uncharacterized protein n=1 Tax=Crepidotus variabilis TaxID=179855 RepID=A0A9P6JIY8_9AGAR|nr:hypothetical protein CPB83DRAFT_96829 [Crepidotus variabilis]
MEAFFREASRWKHICIVGHAELLEHISGYTSEVAAVAHQLSSLYLHSTAWFPVKCTFSIGSSDASLPSPSHLSLTNIAIEINSFDLSRLTSLRLPPITVTKIIHIFTRASSLNKLTTGIAPPELAESSSFQDWDSPFQHTSLKILDLEVNFLGVVGQGPFCRLTLPSLESLSCSIGGMKLSILQNF